MHFGGEEIWLHSFLTSKLNGRTAGKNPGTQWREEEKKKRKKLLDELNPLAPEFYI